MENEYKELIERVRLIDPAAAEYLEGDDIKKHNFIVHKSLASVMIWSETPQGNQYWGDIYEQLSWKSREQGRMNDGTYKPVNLANDDPNRFLHVSLLNPDMVAYTASDEKGQTDIQTRTTLKGYIRKFGLETTGHVPSDSLDEAKVISSLDEAKALLLRAAGSLQDYCSESGGDMNDSLAMEIYTWLEQIKEM